MKWEDWGLMGLTLCIMMVVLGAVGSCHERAGGREAVDRLASCVVPRMMFARTSSDSVRAFNLCLREARIRADSSR